jgi:hypothetical protein
MNSLLERAVDAHGGLDRWNQFTALEAKLSIGGAIWSSKQQPGLLTNVTYEIETHEERLTIDGFSGRGRRLAFVPDKLQLETIDGKTIEARDNPRSAFAGQTAETPWDRLHAGYFASYALWTYLNSPFLYTYPGFITEEIESWRENGEVWRRLKITFPETVASHTREQITHFGPDGVMRRHDYTVDVLGGATGANYTTDYRDFQGIKIPTRRRVYAYDAQMKKQPEPVLVSIDIEHVTLKR